jgi:hypothetical protein
MWKLAVISARSWSCVRVMRPVIALFIGINYPVAAVRQLAVRLASVTGNIVSVIALFAIVFNAIPAFCFAAGFMHACAVFQAAILGG